MAKQYNISDLFITSWLDQEGNPTLSPEDHARVLEIRHKLDTAKADKKDDVAGLYSILMLRILRKKKDAVSKINVDQVVDCINDINFFREPWYFFPKSAKGIFQAPDEKMHDRNFEQLVYADSAFTKFLIMDREKDPTAVRILDELIAILYNDPEEFKPEHISDRAKLVADLQDHQKALILATYAHIREYIVERCPNLFPKPNTSPAGEPDQSEGQIEGVQHTGPMWRKLLYCFAETEAFKGYDRARTAKIYDALDYLEQKTIEASELKPKAHAQS